MLFIDEKFWENTFTLEEFVTQSSLQADRVHMQLQSLRAACLSITADACQVSLIIKDFLLFGAQYSIQGASLGRTDLITVKSVLTEVHVCPFQRLDNSCMHKTCSCI